MHILEPKGKLGRRDTPRPADFKNRVNLLPQPLSAFAEDEEEERDLEDKFDGDRGMITEQKTITKVYEEVLKLRCHSCVGFVNHCMPLS